MEIERKYKITQLPSNLEQYQCKILSQGYIYTHPAIRIRQSNEEFFLTVKGEGLVAREEFEIPITEQVYADLQKKIEGLMIHKTRYLIPYEQWTIELDCFHNEYNGLCIAEVEFDSIEASESFCPPDWFGEDVTDNRIYQNSQMSKGFNPELLVK